VSRSHTRLQVKKKLARVHIYIYIYIYILTINSNKAPSRDYVGSNERTYTKRQTTIYPAATKPINDTQYIEFYPQNPSSGAKAPKPNLIKYFRQRLREQHLRNARQTNIMGGPDEPGHQLTPQPSSWKDSLSYNPRVGRFDKASPPPSATPPDDESCAASGNRVSPCVPSSRGGDALGGKNPSPPIEERKCWSAADICKNESALVTLAAYD